MVRCADWDEEFFEVVSVSFGWMFLIWVAVLGRHTPPSPLKRGGWEVTFLLEMSGL